MPTLRLTKAAIDNAKPEVRDAFLWDATLRGLGVKITPSGSKVFIYQYRMGGRGSKLRRFTIGRYGELTLEAARRKAEELARQVRLDGNDPLEAKRSARAKAAELAFANYAERFWRECLQIEWRSSHAQSYRALELHAVPKLGDKPLNAITRSDIRAVIEPLRAQVATASLVFATLRRMFNWAIEREDIEQSPVMGMKAPPLPTSRDRVLSDEELRLVWLAAGELGYPAGTWVRLLILTGARRTEAAALDWAELDRSAALWTLPAGRSKNARVAVNPLSGAALALLDEVASQQRSGGAWPNFGAVFPTRDGKPIVGYSKIKLRLEKAISKLAEAEGIPDLAPWRLHDLRRTLATGLQRLGTRLEVTEAVLNHVSGSRGGIVGVYQRHSYLPEQLTALTAWAAHVERIVAGGPAADNIVRLEALA